VLGGENIRPYAYPELQPLFLDKQAFASTLPDITKKKTTNRPTSSIFLSGHRPVFVMNTTTLDVGVAWISSHICDTDILLGRPGIRIRREIQATLLLQ
jgi:hypothetical protein